MKRISAVLSVILAVVLCFTAMPVSYAVTDEELRLFVASDIHIKSRDAVGDLSQAEEFNADDPFYDATIQGQMTNISEAVNRAFFKEFLNSDEQILLIAGDLTSSAKPVDHECLRDIMQQTLDEAAAMGLNKKIYVINGNHDIDDDDTEKFTSAEEFKACYEQFGYADADEIDENSCSYSTVLAPGYRLIAVDSCVYGQDDGELTAERFEWIKQQTEKAKEADEVVILMAHHSIVKHYNLQFTVKCKGEASDVLSAMGIRYAFTGHIHANDISAASFDDGRKIYDIMTGSLITSPCSYRRVRFSPESVDISTEYINAVDAADLPQGLSDIQYNKILYDFEGYKADFFKAGINYWVQKNLCTPHFFARKLKLQEGTKAYDAAAYVTNCLSDVLTMPLYETEETAEECDSFEELTAKCGYTLPQSDYRYAGDVVADIVADFYAGDENNQYKDEKMQILFGVLSSGLVYAFIELLTGAQRDKAQALFNAIGVAVDKVSGTPAETLLVSKNAANIVVGAVVIPALGGITTDDYAPGDLAVSLDGTAAEPLSGDAATPVTLLQVIISLIKSFFRFVMELLTK